MKTSTMVWTVVVVLVLLGAGWYLWMQNSTANDYAQTDQTGLVPNGQTQVNTNPTGADYQPSRDQTATSVAPMTAAVTYNGETFTPSTVVVAKGGTVTFTDTVGTMWLASDPHPTHTNYDGTTRSAHCAAGYTGAAPFDQCSKGASYSFTFNKVGTWGYHDHANDAASATVVVQ